MFGEIIENRDPHSSSIPHLLSVFMLAFVVRILFPAWRGPTLSFDSNEYLTLAHNFDGGQDYWQAFQIEASAGERRIDGPPRSE
jgi:hypothetical protein